MAEKKFPILNQPYRRERALTEIPWAVAERAYVVYARQYGSSQTLERLAERGGFAESELDTLLPCWRLMSENESEAVWTYKLELVADNEQLRKRMEIAEGHIRRLLVLADDAAGLERYKAARRFLGLEE